MKKLFTIVAVIACLAVLSRFAVNNNPTEDTYVAADESCRTKTLGIFVAGDCRTKSVRQLTTAASDGAVAALAACSYIG